GGPRPRAGAEREGPGEGGRRGGCDRPGDGEGVAGAAVTEGLSKVERGGTAPHPQVRLARAGDDLSAVLGSTDPLAWNPQQVLIAESDGRIVGMMALFDGGHRMLMIDHFIVGKQAPLNTGAWLMEGLLAYAKAAGKTSLIFTTTSMELAYQAKRRGG